MMLASFAVVLIVGVFGGAPQAPAEPRACLVVVNEGNPAAELTRAEVADIFLRKVTRWQNGISVAAVDQSTMAPVRRCFSEEVLGMKIGTVQSYWQAKVLSGREIPPRVFSTNADVLEFVRQSREAVGYVSADATLPSGVKALRIR